MKKTLALLLALLLALASPALAENDALVLRTSDIAASVAAGGETRALDIRDFGLTAALDTAGDLQLTLEARSGGSRLALAALRLKDGKLQLAFDGLDTTYEAELPGLSGADAPDLAGLVRPLLPELMGLRLPMIPAPAIPKANFAPLFADYAAQNTAEDGPGVSRFEISQEQAARLAGKLAKSLKDMNAAGLEPLIELLEDYEAFGVGFSFKIKVADTGAEQTCEIEVYVYNKGEVADTPTAVLALNSAENRFSLALGLPEETDLYNILELSLTSDPETAAFNLEGQALHAFTGTLAASQADGMQYIDLDYSADPLDASGSADAFYSHADGADFLSVLGKVGVSGDYEFTHSGVADGDTAYFGSVTVRTRSGSSSFELSADYVQSLERYDPAFAMPAATAPLETLDAEAVAQAFKPLSDYFAQFLPGSEAEEAESPAA